MRSKPHSRQDRPARQRPPAAQRALLEQSLAGARLGGCSLIRPGGSADFGTLAQEAGLPYLLARLFVAQTVSHGLWIFSWWVLGRMILTGRLDFGWFGAWLLLLLTLIPIRLLATSSGGLLAISVGTVIKRRLLFGALKLEPDEVRHMGVGQLLGRVIESGAVETMVLSGAFQGLGAVVELVFAGLVLGVGAGGWGHASLLLGAVAAAAGLGYRFAFRLRLWTQGRLDMTNDLVERMAGHRTRLAQERREHWHDGEDQALARYLENSQNLDRAVVALQVQVPRGWSLIGLLGLAPAFVSGSSSAESLAVGVGGILLAHRALRQLTDGLERLAAAAIAWERVAPFWQAAFRREPMSDLRFAVTTPAKEPSAGHSARRPPHLDSQPLLDACDLTFRYEDRAEPVLQGTELVIRKGDHLLLEGPSGGGKSTFASLLAGCRAPAAGLILLDGLDRKTLGAESWRRRLVLAPQFHENHVFMGTLAFNALMGRGWPPQPSDLDETERVCRGLGLGPLLERMPAGIQQLIGETGWQLSHGEKSRLYIARALLQGAEIFILDESFAALDPQTLHDSLTFVLEEALRCWS